MKRFFSSKALTFIGGGNITKAMVNGVIQSKLYKPSRIIISDKNVDMKNMNFLVFISIDNITIEPQRKRFAILKRGSFVLLIKYLCIKYAIETNIIVSEIVK